MSIEALCTGDTVVPQTITTTVGEGGSPVRVPTDGSGLDCLIQTPGHSEVRDYAARGQRLSYQVFFSADPGLTNNHTLKWTVRRNATLATPIYLRVLDCYSEGRPGAGGEDLLWIADCEQVTSRKER